MFVSIQQLCYIQRHQTIRQDNQRCVYNFFLMFFLFTLKSHNCFAFRCHQFFNKFVTSCFIKIFLTFGENHYSFPSFTSFNKNLFAVHNFHFFGTINQLFVLLLLLLLLLLRGGVIIVDVLVLFITTGFGKTDCVDWSICLLDGFGEEPWFFITGNGLVVVDLFLIDGFLILPYDLSTTRWPYFLANDFISARSS